MKKKIKKSVGTQMQEDDVIFIRKFPSHPTE